MVTYLLTTQLIRYHPGEDLIRVCQMRIIGRPNNLWIRTPEPMLVTRFNSFLANTQFIPQFFRVSYFVGENEEAVDT